MSYSASALCLQVQQPGTTMTQPSTVANRRHANESDYEEIGPPPVAKNNTNIAAATSGSGGDLVCDLCGTTAAIVRCAACADQIFCLSCDDMYHRHPRRTSHARKALAQQIRPPLPPKGSENVVPTPVAPPRKNLLRKGSAPDSPVTPTRNTANELPLPSRSSTLPRKMGSMVGRPLPPPPATNNPPGPPPPLPPVSSSSTASTAAPPLPAKTPSASQPPAFYPMNDHNMHRKLSTTSQPPMHLQFGHPHHPEIPLPGYPMGVHPAFMDRYPGPPPPPNVSQSWKSNPYLEEMEFPTRASNMAMNGFNNEASNSARNNKRMPPAQRSRFYKLNKSSSLHDIAHEEMNTRLRGNHELNNGISWMDEPWNTTQSTMNQPTMNMQELLDQQRNFRRASSTKSLHQNSDIWNGSNMWPQAPPVPNAPNNPMMQPGMMNPMLFAAMAGNQMPPAAAVNNALSHQIPSSLHRSMHELHINRAPSPTMSQKSKKSTRSDRFLNRANKSRRNPQSSTENKPSSRPHSRNKSRRDKKYRDSSRTRHNRRRSISTEDDMDSEEVMVNDLDEVDMDDEEDEDDEDFFTGESDNDFLSISSGSNSKRAPRKAWTCEHCTYVNNPGVGICAMCCRTTNASKHRNEDYSNERSSSRASTRKKKSHRSKYESSEEDESEIKHKRNSESKTNSLRRRSGKDTKASSGGQRKKHAKSPMPEMQVSDPDDDAINEYYAVRHMDTSRNRMDSEGRCESSSETSSMHNNPLRKPNLDAPAPAKGILKKSNSNLELTKIEQGKTIGPPGRVVDIKKYLAQGPPASDLTNDIWQTEKNEWMRRQNGGFSKQDNEYLTDDAASNSSTTNNVGRPSMTRSISGHSLGDLEYMQQQYDHQQQQLQQNQRSSNRRTSDVGGKRNFRSKRFSRNLEREPALRRAQSLHMDRRGLEEDFVDHRASLIRKSSANKQHSSGSSEDTMHFTATVHSSANQEMLGSHLARQEFGGNHEGIGDSGYMSHSSGMSRVTLFLF